MAVLESQSYDSNDSDIDSVGKTPIKLLPPKSLFLETTNIHHKSLQDNNFFSPSNLSVSEYSENSDGFDTDQDIESTQLLSISCL
ncbi:hypothetical protein AYI68_g2426 [Smittium mucronatum]|uniref:Uncharacterized protein n=1 Tax=Smittium mucronatum TaxID=133383 RepID=A0A1R0H2P5_9FUNG|nr:hypothetical protein AYI68_g2426 [Smittium mucronatum]